MNDCRDRPVWSARGRHHPVLGGGHRTARRDCDNPASLSGTHVDLAVLANGVSSELGDPPQAQPKNAYVNTRSGHRTSMRWPQRRIRRDLPDSFGFRRAEWPPIVGSDRPRPSRVPARRADPEFFLRVASLHSVQRSSIRPPLPLRAPADRAQALPARIGLLALLGVLALPAGRRAGHPDRRPADRPVPRPFTGGIELAASPSGMPWSGFIHVATGTPE
jgi:hypothetical protein